MKSTIGLLALAAGLAACQPQKTPEQIQAEQAAAALSQMAGALGQLAGPDGAAAAAQMNPEQMAAALAQAGAMAGAMNPDMTPEERAKMQAITGAIASGQVHPAASSYVAGLDKVFTILSGIKDVGGADAAKPKLAAIYAEMAGPAATLKAMTEDERDVAFGSAYIQMSGFGMKMAGLMMPLTSNPALAEKVGDLLEDMPEPQ